MGQPKLLLPWGNSTILGHLIGQWLAVGANQIGVVCAEDDRLIPEAFRRLAPTASDLILNPAADRGMFSSIQCAAGWDSWNAGLTHWAIVLGDQPHLHASTLQTLVSFALLNPSQVCQPSRNGHARHPVIMPKSVFLNLPGSPAGTLREFLLTAKVTVFESDDPGLELDLDRPEDYATALKKFAGSRTGIEPES